MNRIIKKVKIDKKDYVWVQISDSLAKLVEYTDDVKAELKAMDYESKINKVKQIRGKIHV